MTFNAQAGVPYHFWMRGKADKNNWANDSVYVQFSGTVDVTRRRDLSHRHDVGDVGSASKNGTNAGLSPAGAGTTIPMRAFAAPLYFATSGPQTIRVQVREDGLVDRPDRVELRGVPDDRRQARRRTTRRFSRVDCRAAGRVLSGPGFSAGRSCCCRAACCARISASMSAPRSLPSSPAR